MTVSPHSSEAAGSSGAFDLLHLLVQRWIYDQGWTSLRDVQERSAAPILDGGRDVIISAATAAGKTEAAFLPILSVLATTRDQTRVPAAEVASTAGIEVLCVSPLRALINDQYDRLEQMCERVGVRAHRWHGDVAQSSKLRALQAPSGVLLITPESLEAILVNRGTAVRGLFSRLRYVVIDELHVFLGTPRGAQVQSLLNRVELSIRRRPPRIALSATLADMDRAAAFLRPEHPDEVVVVSDAAGGSELRLQVRGYVESSGLPETAASEAPATDAHDDEAVATDRAVGPREEITGHIFENLRGQDNLIFANTRADVELYADRLRQRSSREHVPNEFWPHHGSLAKGIREAAEEALKDRTRPATSVCTSTLEMGIDIGSLDSVVQVGPPPSVASMRQRLGRSGRRGRPAVLRVYITEKATQRDLHPVDELRCEIVQTIAMVRLMLAGWLEDPDDPGFNYSTLVQQALSMIAQHGGARNSELRRALCGPGPFQRVDGVRFERLLRSMADKDLIVEASDGILLHGAVGERCVNHHSFYAAFWTPAEWRLVADGRTLGTVPIDFAVALGDQLIFAGTRWTVVDVDESARVIQLAQSKGGRPPTFGGAAPLVADRVRQEMATVYESDETSAWLDPRARELLTEGRAAWRGFRLGESAVLECDSGVLLFPWVGDRALHTIALALRRAGIAGVSVWGPAIQVEGEGRRPGSGEAPGGRARAGLGEIGAAVRNLLAQRQPDASDLAATVTNRRIDKWDWVLDRTLSLEAAGVRLLDVEGAWRALERVEADLDSTSSVSSERS